MSLDMNASCNFVVCYFGIFVVAFKAASERQRGCSVEINSRNLPGS